MPTIKEVFSKSVLNPIHWDWRVLARAFYFLVALAVLASSFIIIRDELEYRRLSSGYEEKDGGEVAEEGECNVTGIELQGELTTYGSPLDSDQAIDYTSADDIVGAIEEIDADDSVKAIILEIDSYGGNPVAAEEVANALKAASKPTVALVRTRALSAAYWSATGADVIFASSLSDVGSIGVTMSYIDYSQQNAKDGLIYNSLSTGKFKDAGDPDKPLTAEEKTLFMRDINIANDIFIAQVAANRKLEESKVRALADGSSLPGQLALESGLIDMIGGMPEVEEYLEKKIGEGIDICWY